MRTRSALLPPSLRLTVVLLCTLVCSAAPSDQVQQIQLASEGIPGDTPDCASGVADPLYQQPAVYSSANGRFVAFASCAMNLVSGQSDTAVHSSSASLYSDVFLHDRVSGTTTLVSHTAASASIAANGSAVPVGISGDGRWVLFSSAAAQLTPGQDSNNGSDLYLHDRLDGSNLLVSHAADLAINAANRPASEPSLSADGRYVLFSSAASNLVAGITSAPDVVQVYLFDRSTQLTELVSVSAGATTVAGNGRSGVARITPDGRYVSFASTADNLVPGQQPTAGYTNLYLRDRPAQQTLLASRAAGSSTLGAGISAVLYAPFPGSPSYAPEPPPAIAADGTVFFSSDAADLVESDLPVTDVYAFTPSTGQTRRLSHSHAHPTRSGDGYSRLITGSPDGRWLLLASAANDLVSGQLPTPEHQPAAFLYDRLADTFTLVSHAAGTPLQPVYAAPRLVSADGGRVVFHSDAIGQLLPGASAGTVNHVFSFDRSTGSVSLGDALSGASTTASARGAIAATLSADGTQLFFISDDRRHDLSIQDRNGKGDLFERSLLTGANQTRSRAVDAVPATANGWTNSHSISADGGWLLLSSTASNLAPGVVDDNGMSDVYLFDPQLRQHILVSRLAGLPQHAAAGRSYAQGLSADGRWVLFLSNATGLVQGVADIPGSDDLFLFDRQTGFMRQLTLTSNGQGSSNGVLENAFLSSNGQQVVFASDATDLVAGVTDTNQRTDLFLFDIASAQTTLLSRSALAANQAADQGSQLTAISGDGNWVLYSSHASDLAEPATDAGGALYLYGRIGQTLQRVTRYDWRQGAIANGFALSHDGRWVAFESSVAGLDPDVIDLNGTSDVFLYDRLSGQTRLVSRSYLPGILAAENASSPWGLSADGRYLMFDSSARDLVPGTPSTGIPYPYGYFFDRDSGRVGLLGQQQGNGIPLISHGGRVAPSGHYAFLQPDFRPAQRIDLQTGQTVNLQGNDPGGYGYVTAVSVDGTVAAVDTESRPAVQGFRDNNGTPDAYLSTLAASPQRIFVEVLGTAPPLSTPGSPVIVTVRVRGEPAAPSGGQVVVSAVGASNCIDGEGLSDGQGGLLFECQLVLQTGIWGLRAEYVEPVSNATGSTLWRYPHPVSGLDFGNAPDSYGTRLAHNGPRHGTNSPLFLGQRAPDAEADGPAADQTEDTPLFPAMQRAVPTEVEVVVSASGYLNVFVDFNLDGSFNTAEEHWVRDAPVQRGTNALTLTVPQTSGASVLVSRTRVSSAPGLSHLGPAADGEVEDGSIQVINHVPQITDPGPQQILEDSTLDLSLTVVDPDSAPASLFVRAHSFLPSLIPYTVAQPGPQPNQWILGLQPTADANGVVTLSVHASDSEQVIGSQQFAVKVLSVNDPPSFEIAGNLVHPAGSIGSVSQPQFARNVRLGPPNESDQGVLSYQLVELSDARNVVGSIALANDGSLSYQLTGTAGTAAFEATLVDTGGRANGGVPHSTPLLFTIAVQQTADVQVSNSNGLSVLLQGEAVSYEIVVSNNGPNPASGVTLLDFEPSGLSAVSWTCTPVALATCAAASGSGGILAGLDLPAGGALRYRLSATVTAAAGSRVQNTAFLVLPSHVLDGVAANDSATDDDPVESDVLLRDGFE